MLNRKQYIRLTLVLLLPMLGLGWWLAESEYIEPNNHLIICTEYVERINCFSTSSTAKSKSERLNERGSVRLAGALLTSGFNHPVVILASAGTAAPQGGAPDATRIASGTKIRMILPNRTANGEFAWYCDILRNAEEPQRWTSWCQNFAVRIEDFRFENESTQRKFDEAEKYIERLRTERQASDKNTKTITVFVPLVLYFLLSAAIYLLILVTRFVIHGGMKSKA